MKPPVFKYCAPKSLEEAVSLRHENAPDSVVLAGGQSLMPMLNLRQASPATVIDIGGVSELAGIRPWGDGVAVGAMTRQRAAERSELLTDRVPLMGQALTKVGHVSVRNRGTVGGSLAHADPAAELPAVVVALGADLLACSVRGERAIPADGFFCGAYRTSLEPDELLVDIRLPGARPGPDPGAAFVELARRHNDVPVVGVAAMTVVREGVLDDVRIVLTGVSCSPVRAHAAEELLRGEVPGHDAYAAAAEVAMTEIDPGSDFVATGAYRRRIAGVLVRRALAEATG